MRGDAFVQEMTPPMQSRALGKDGPSVSVLTLGTMTFGDGTDERTAGRIVDIVLWVVMPEREPEPTRTG